MVKRPADDTVWSLVEGRKEKRQRRLLDERKTMREKTKIKKVRCFVMESMYKLT